MATTVPYAAPFARVRQPSRLNRRFVRYVAMCVAGAVIIAFIQLWLASEVTATLIDMAATDGEIAVLRGQVGALEAQAEEMSSPPRIEREAIRLNLKPITNIEFLR